MLFTADKAATTLMFHKSHYAIQDVAGVHSISKCDMPMISMALLGSNIRDDDRRLTLPDRGKQLPA